MSALTDFKRRLEEVLDEHFPKVEEEGPEKEAVRRGAGLCLFAEAVIEANKIAMAFGSCEKCYGKGYSTQRTDGETRINYCSCGRGKELERLVGYY